MAEMQAFFGSLLPAYAEQRKSWQDNPPQGHARKYARPRQKGGSKKGKGPQ